LKDVSPLGVFAIHPPCEVDEQFVKDALEEHVIARAALAGQLVHAPRRPRVHRRIHVAEVELVRGDLSVGMEVQTAQHQ